MAYKICILAILLAAANAFWNTGHMMIAKIAQDQLLQRNSTLFQKVIEEIRGLADLSYDEKYSFIEASIWPDTIKDSGLRLFDHIHVTRTPYIMSDYEGEPIYDPRNITWTIGELKRTLLSSDGDNLNSLFGRSFSWRFLIHIVGDIHQP